MKFFQNCLRSQCEQLKFKFEQKQNLFQQVYQHYSQCVDKKFHDIGIYATEKGNNNIVNGDVIGSGVIIDNKIQVHNTQFSLANNYKKIVKIYQECQNTRSQGLQELDTFKDCQLHCLDQSVESPSSTLSTNLIIILIISVIGFAIILFLLYKYIMIRKQREYKQQQDIEDSYQQNQDVENCKQVTEKDQKKIINAQVVKPSKIIYGPRIKGGLTRLNINKMIQIVNNLKKDYPELQEDDQIGDNYSIQQKNEFGQNKNLEDYVNDGISQNNSEIIECKQIQKMAKHRKTDSNVPMIQQTNSPSVNNYSQNQFQSTSDLSLNNILQSEYYSAQQQLFSPLAKQLFSLQTSENADEKMIDHMNIEFQLENNLMRSVSEQKDQEMIQNINQEQNQQNTDHEQQKTQPQKIQNSLNLIIKTQQQVFEKLIYNSPLFSNEQQQQSQVLNTFNNNEFVRQHSIEQNQLFRQQSEEVNLKGERSNQISSQETLSYDNLESPAQSPEYLNKNKSSLMNHIYLIKSQMDQESEDPNNQILQCAQ